MKYVGRLLNRVLFSCDSANLFDIRSVILKKCFQIKCTFTILTKLVLIRKVIFELIIIFKQFIISSLRIVSFDIKVNFDDLYSKEVKEIIVCETHLNAGFLL